MKFRVQLKDPDGFYEALSEAAKESLRGVGGISNAERDALAEQRQRELDEAIEAWVEYGEYVTIEFDTDAGTAKVLTLGEAA